MNVAYQEDLCSESREVFHDLYNKFYGRDVPHEWFFINFLLKSEMKKGPTIAGKFVMFIVQFYPRYRWRLFLPDDLFTTVVLECALHDYNFLKSFAELDDIEASNQSMLFGDLVTEFLIRFCGYSLIKCGGLKVIITAHSDCDKRFSELLEDGFSLHRIAKLGFMGLPAELRSLYPEIEGFFYKLPVLPTKDIHIDFAEAIESVEGKVCDVLQKSYALKPKEKEKALTEINH